MRTFRINKDGSRTLVSTATLSSKASLKSIDSLDSEIKPKFIRKRIFYTDRKLKPKSQTEEIKEAKTEKKPKKKKSLKKMIILQRS